MDFRICVNFAFAVLYFVISVFGLVYSIWPNNLPKSSVFSMTEPGIVLLLLRCGLCVVWNVYSEQLLMYVTGKSGTYDVNYATQSEVSSSTS